MKTLEQIIKEEKVHRRESGIFGIAACKDAIKSRAERDQKDYYAQLRDYVERANNETLFNSAMVLACWELINEK